MNTYMSTQGIEVYYGVDLAHATTQLKGLADIPMLPKRTKKEIDITRLDQVDGSGNADLYEQFAFDRRNSGTFSVTMGADQDQIAAVEAMEDTPYVYKVVYPSGAYEYFTATLQDSGRKPKTGGETLFDATFKVSGKSVFVKAPVLTAVAGTGTKIITLTFSSAITAATVPPGKVFTMHAGGLAIPADSVSQGAANTLTATSTLWQAAPTGDSYILQAVLGVTPGAVGIIA